MTEVQRQSIREREELRVLKTIEMTCRNCDVIMHVGYTPPDGDGVTWLAMSYDYRSANRRRMWRSYIAACAAFVIMVCLEPWRPQLLILWAIAGGAWGYFLAAAIRCATTRPITPETLGLCIDADLIAAGFHVTHDPKWCVTMPCPEDGEDEMFRVEPAVPN